ncbi:hypothetical protein GmHk_08G021562 [Glycine max]|nr:hypothetical protein GmHk_08G021562 [Glycine max]
MPFGISLKPNPSRNAPVTSPNVLEQAMAKPELVKLVEDNNIESFIKGKQLTMDEDDDGEGAEPCVCNGEEHIFGYIRSREIFQCNNNHANGHGQ